MEGPIGKDMSHELFVYFIARLCNYKPVTSCISMRSLEFYKYRSNLKYGLSNPDGVSVALKFC